VLTVRKVPQRRPYDGVEGVARLLVGDVWASAADDALAARAPALSGRQIVVAAGAVDRETIALEVVRPAAGESVNRDKSGGFQLSGDVLRGDGYDVDCSFVAVNVYGILTAFVTICTSGTNVTRASQAGGVVGVSCHHNSHDTPRGHDTP